MHTLEDIKGGKLPDHLAVIMDGNGRWARKRNKLRIFGHENAIEAVRDTVESCAKLGIPHLTLYAFSTENWNRPKREVDSLMKLLVAVLKKEVETMHKNDIRLNAIGRIDTLPKKAHAELLEVMAATKNNKRLTLTLALSYGSREEITQAVRGIATKVKNNIISTDDIDDTVINGHLYTQNLPDVDLLIRTSGEHRISNFLLWQIAYAELYFTDVLWPDFRAHHLVEALINYQNRERRFGKTSEQLN
ncbi:MAG: isoprenyl transferase [Flavobacteriaceae bacterium]|nr:isoprenyl transferase [Flavobacteriaceae bacterium]MDH3795296.1 isoprenyl transferase [Flavobacteriaceae bacterium]